MSAEMASSGFQHIVHVTVKAGAAGGRNLQCRFEYPPLTVKGQADPRNRVTDHLAGVLSFMHSVLTSPAGVNGLLEMPLHELHFLGAQERSTLMGQWSGLPLYDTVDRSNQLLQELFEATAAKFPDRIAIEVFQPSFRNMTYAQMDRRTNQLAHWMRKNGVGVGSYVGMWLPRGIDVYIALIAILKAGAAYGLGADRV